MLPIVVSSITTVLCLAGMGYYLLALWSARAFQHQLRRTWPDFEPGVTILKPVKGLDPSNIANRDAAEKACRESGISDPRLLENCILDIAATNEFLFGVRYAQAQRVLSMRITLDFCMDGV